MQPGLGLLAAALGATRLFGVLVVHPWFRRAAGWSWTFVAGALAVVLAGAWVGSGVAPWSPDALSAWVGGGALGVAFALEFGLGALFGLVIALPGFAVDAAASLARPTSVSGDDGVRVDDGLGTLVSAAALAGVMGLGLHQVWLAGLAEVFDGIALGDPAAWIERSADASGRDLALRAHGVVVLALALAAPWWLTRAVVSVAGALVASASPVFEAARRGAEPALVASLGLLSLFAALWAFPAAWGRGLGGL